MTSFSCVHCKTPAVLTNPTFQTYPTNTWSLAAITKLHMEDNYENTKIFTQSFLIIFKKFFLFPIFRQCAASTLDSFRHLSVFPYQYIFGTKTTGKICFTRRWLRSRGKHTATCDHVTNLYLKHCQVMHITI